MLAETVPPCTTTYDLLLDSAFYVVAAFFAAEYVLRLIAAPEAPGFEHYAALAGPAVLGGFAAGHIRPGRRHAGADRAGAAQRPEPLRLRLDIQIRPLLARSCKPGAGGQPRAQRAAVGTAGLRDRAAGRREPRLSARARRQSRCVRLDPGGALVGHRDVDHDRLRRCRAADRRRADARRGGHGQRHPGVRAVGRHSRHRVCRGGAAARVSAHLGIGRQGAVLPQHRRRV